MMVLRNTQVKPRSLALWLFFAPFLCAARAEPARHVEIAEVSPPGPATLPLHQALYVRIHYQSDQPLRVQARGYASGSPPRGAMMNPAPASPSGEHDTIAWVAYAEEATIDEVRVEVTDENWHSLLTVAAPVEAAWSAGAAAPPPAPPWVKELNDAQQQAVSRDAKAMDGALGWIGGAIFFLLMWTVPGYPALQIYALSRLRGWRRRAAALPLVVMIPVYFYCCHALAQESNLWPLGMIFLSPPAFLYVLIVWLLSRRKAT